MVTITTLIGIGESLAESGAAAERALKTPKTSVAAAMLLRMSHGSEMGGRVQRSLQLGRRTLVPAARLPGHICGVRTLVSSIRTSFTRGLRTSFTRQPLQCELFS